MVPRPTDGLGAGMLAALLLAAALAGCTAPPASTPPGQDPPAAPPSPPSPPPAAAPPPTPPALPAPPPPPSPPAPLPCPSLGPIARQFQETAYYAGTLFDDHFHMPQMFRIDDHPEAPVLDEDISKREVVCLFDPARIRGAFGFVAIPAHLKDKGVRAVLDMEQISPGALSSFLEFVVFPGHPVDPPQIEQVLQAVDGAFDGYGELSMYLPHYNGVRPDDPKMRALYAIAERHHLVVMAHPIEDQQQAWETALREHPNVTFLFHGAEYLTWADRMMDGILATYPNARYSADTLLFGDTYGRPLLDSASSKEDFITKFKAGWSTTLDQKAALWKPRIEKHPDRFLWGTDRGSTLWHYDPDIAALLEEYARSFIGRLDPAVQEKFAYRNAYALLQPGNPTVGG